ncbi:MAG TPA: aminopeptidase P family protein [Planctomycetota bacterium]|jgi:Xaa-Pro aminopeptidase
MKNVPPRSELTQRLRGFRDILRKRGISAALITNARNVRYLSGFTGDDSALLITASRKFMITDFRFIEEAGLTAKGWKLIFEKSVREPDGKMRVIVPHGLMEKAGYMCRKLRLRRLAVESADMRVVDMRALRKAARGVRVKPEDALVAELRVCKSAWEVKQIEHALRIQERCFRELCTGLKAGMTERDAAAYLRYLMVRAGAEDEAFTCMFQMGSHSSLPHGRPTDRRLGRDAIILLDFGSRYAGYHSDLTRTFFLGRIPPRLRHIHQIVLEAQQAAIATVAPGVKMADVDAASRAVISKAGYGAEFGHSTGHGLGMDIHEAPSLSARAKGTLREGMVVTVEPGIYLPGVGGVRIEDDVLVTRTGHRVLSRLSVGLRWTGEND